MHTHLILSMLVAGVGQVSVQDPHTLNDKERPQGWNAAIVASAAGTGDPIGASSLCLMLPRAVKPATRLDLSDMAIEDRARIRNFAENHWEATAYCLALVTASETPVKAFEKGARKDISYAHLFEEPAKYRGEIIHIEGRLKRLLKFDAPRFVHNDGIRTIYEGWVFDAERLGTHPICFICTSLPKGLEPTENSDARISFDGFFFKRYRYKAADNHTYDCPLLIGHEPILLSMPERPIADEYGSTMFWLMSFVLGGTALGVVALALYFRQGDRNVRRRLVAGPEPTWEDQTEPNS